MEARIKECGDAIISMVLALKNGKTGPGSRVTSVKERNSASVFTCGETVHHTRDVGRTVK
jgi:hypothetical protein